MKKLNICIDIDGTITDPYHYLPYLNEMYKKNITKEECSTILWEELYSVNFDEMIKEFNEKYSHSYDEAVVIKEAKEIINELKKNHNLYFVTARNNGLEGITKNWLNKNEIHDIEVYLLGCDDKIGKARELECHIFIEDNPFNAINLASEGLKVLL